jgi:hypothetical protein
MNNTLLSVRTSAEYPRKSRAALTPRWHSILPSVIQRPRLHPHGAHLVHVDGLFVRNRVFDLITRTKMLPSKGPTFSIMPEVSTKIVPEERREGSLCRPVGALNRALGWLPESLFDHYNIHPRQMPRIGLSQPLDHRRPAIQLYQSPTSGLKSGRTAYMIVIGLLVD